MANVLFKRGLQQSLPREGYAVDGVFYLTTDTHRLYVGQDTNPVLLNQTVNFVNSVSELEEKAALWKREGSEAAHAQDLYYILPNGGGENTHGGNILAVWCKDANNQYAWVQINPDHNTFLTDAQILVTAINNGANVKTTMTMNNSDTLPVDFNVKGSGNTIDIDVDADQNIVVKGDTYTLSRPATGEIKLTSALGQDASSVKIVGGDNVTIEDGTAAGDIKISAKDTINTAASLTLDAAGKLTMQVTDSNADVVTAFTDAITMKYGATGSLSAPIGGTLEVYSRSEVDEKFKDLNGLTYVGTVGENGQYLMGNDYKVYNGQTAIDVHNGDMFLVAGDDVAYAAGAKANKGDILIATGTETNGVLSAIAWTFIPSGDDAKLDTTYNFDGSAADNSMTIRSISSLEGEKGVVGKIAFTAGEATAISSQVSGNTADKNEILNVTVSHGAVAHTDAAGADVDLNSDDSVNVVTGVTVNDHGHVTNVTTSKVFAPRYNLSAAPQLAAASSGIQTSVTIKQGIQINGGKEVFQTTGYKLQSDSLTITAKDGNVQVDYVWGTF